MTNYLEATGRDRLRSKGVSLGKKVLSDGNISYFIARYDRLRTVGVSLEDAKPNPRQTHHSYAEVELSTVFPSVLINDIVYDPPHIFSHDGNVLVPSFTIPSIDVDIVLIEPTFVTKDIPENVPLFLLPSLNNVNTYKYASPSDENIPDLSVELSIVFPSLYIDPRAEYQVDYDANGGTGTPPVDDAWYRNEGIVTLPENTDLAKDGYTWSGWNTEADGSGTDYDPVDTFEILTMTTIYSKWL